MSRKKTKASAPVVIDEPSVSHAWGRLMRHIADNFGDQIAPLVVSVSGFGANGEVPEDPLIRARLDAALQAMPDGKNRYDIETVAFTIFPQRYWRMSHGDRAKLFAFYKDAAPRLMAMNTANRRGLYFERLVQFGSGPCDGNQLEWIISQHNARRGVRDSMFQATTFDPKRDHIADARLSFPCLQQVSFVPTTAGLVVNAFYATQQIFDKAYGNYLGLAHLGSFMAREMQLKFARLNVTVGVAKLDGISKSHEVLTPVFDAIDIALASDDSGAIAANG